MENGPQGTMGGRHRRDNPEVTPFGMLAMFGLGAALLTDCLNWWLGGFTWREGMVIGFAVGALYISLRVVTRDP